MLKSMKSKVCFRPGADESRRSIFRAIEGSTNQFVPKNLADGPG